MHQKWDQGTLGTQRSTLIGSRTRLGPSIDPAWPFNTPNMLQKPSYLSLNILLPCNSNNGACTPPHHASTLWTGGNMGLMDMSLITGDTNINYEGVLMVFGGFLEDPPPLIHFYFIFTIVKPPTQPQLNST